MKNKINKFFDKTKSFYRQHKKPILISSAAVALFAVPLSIYFTQTMFFYNMASLNKQEGNNVDTLYSHDSIVTKRYKRTIPSIMTSYKKTDQATGATTIVPYSYPLNDYPYPNNPDDLSKRTDGFALMQKHILEAQDYMNSAYLYELANTNKMTKHPIADYQYGYENRLPDNVDAVQKVFNFDLTQPGMYTTGLYLAPGEILTVSFKNKTDEEIQKLNLNLTLGLSDSSTLTQDSKISKSYNRMPQLMSQIKITKNNFKFGSPFGGIVNIENNSPQNGSINNNVAVQIDGAVEALHYIHGYTTEKEWKRLVKEAKAPVFDISSDHVKFLGPKKQLTNFRIEKNNPLDSKFYPYRSMDLFDKMALDGLYTINDNAKRLPPIRTSFTNFVPAGEAVSFVRAFFVIAPWYWVDHIVDYDNLINNGNWGIMHENNHQNQNGVWGYTGHGEVTNNVLTMVSYNKFTNIWNDRDNKFNSSSHESKTNGYNAQNYINKNYGKNYTGTANEREGHDFDYGIIMSQFGTDKFQNIIRSYTDSTILDAYGQPIVIPASIVDQRNARFVYRISAITGYDFSQYAYNTHLITSQHAQIINSDLSSKGYKKYMPVFSFYASNTNYDNKGYVQSARPFLIKKDKFETGIEFNLDVNKYDTSNPNSHTNIGGYTITSSYNQINQYQISDLKILKTPNNGTWTNLGNNRFNYVPNTNNLNKKDYFEYSVNVTEKLNGVTPIGTNSSEPIEVKFRVDLELEGNTNEFVVPGNANFQQFYQEQEIKNPKTNVGNIEIPTDATFVNGTNILDIIENTDNKQYFRTNNKVSTATIKINLKSPINLNYLTIKPQQSHGDTTPDGLIIKANNSEVYNGAFQKGVESTYEFNYSQNVSSLEITFRVFNLVPVNNIPTGNINKTTDFKEEIRTTNISINSLKLGVKSKPNQVLTPNSDWIYHVGDWRQGNGDGKVNGSSLFTILPSAKAQFVFQGTSFTIVGTKDKNYGSFDVFIDNKLIQTVSTNSSSRNPNQPLLIVTGLDPNKDHVVSILTKESKPVELQYISLFGNAKPINVNDWYYFLAVGLPIIFVLLIALITFIVLYNLSRKGKKINFDKFLSKFKIKDQKESEVKTNKTIADRNVGTKQKNENYSKLSSDNKQVIKKSKFKKGNNGE